MYPIVAIIPNIAPAPNIPIIKLKTNLLNELKQKWLNLDKMLINKK